MKACTQVDLTFLETGEVPKGGLSDSQFDALARAVVGSEVKIDVVMKLLGLWHTRHTIVGNALLRGVSGGERHRVTTAEMLVGPRSILMMDEISTGAAANVFSSFNNLNKEILTKKLCACLGRAGQRDAVLNHQDAWQLYGVLPLQHAHRAAAAAARGDRCV